MQESPLSPGSGNGHALIGQQEYEPESDDLPSDSYGTHKRRERWIVGGIVIHLLIAACTLASVVYLHPGVSTTGAGFELTTPSSTSRQLHPAGCPAPTACPPVTVEVTACPPPPPAPVCTVCPVCPGATTAVTEPAQVAPPPSAPSAEKPAYELPVDLSSPDLCAAWKQNGPHPGYPLSVPQELQKYCSVGYPMTPYEPPMKLTKDDLAIGLLTVDVYKFSRDEYCMQSWVTPQRAPNTYFTCTIKRDGAIETPCLDIPSSDDLYNSNVNKTLIGLRELYKKHPDAKWFWLSSDDAFINIPYTLKKLETLDHDKEYYVGLPIGDPTCPDTGKKMPYAAGGIGILASRGMMKRAAELIEPYLLNVWQPPHPDPHNLFRDTLRFGDIAAGCFFGSLGHPTTFLPGFHMGTPLAGWDSHLNDSPRSAETNNWHYVGGEQFFHADLLYGLNMIDRLHRNGQLVLLAKYARETLTERYHQQHRNIRLMRHWRKKAGEQDHGAQNP